MPTNMLSTPMSVYAHKHVRIHAIVTVDRASLGASSIVPYTIYTESVCDWAGRRVCALCEWMCVHTCRCSCSERRGNLAVIPVSRGLRLVTQSEIRDSGVVRVLSTVGAG
jgi:hypothetical protein